MKQKPPTKQTTKNPKPKENQNQLSTDCIIIGLKVIS